MRIASVLLGVVSGFVFMSAIAPMAQACTLLPPPRWDLVPQEGGRAIAIGRIVSVTPDGGDEWTDFAIAEVETLEVLQGDMPPRFSVRGIIARRPDPSVITMWCGRLMTDQPDDVVMAIAWGERRYDFLMTGQIAEPYLARMQSYRSRTSDER